MRRALDVIQDIPRYAAEGWEAIREGEKEWLVAIHDRQGCRHVVAPIASILTPSSPAAPPLTLTFSFAQGFEHSVVNMFVIPAGMILGSQVSFSDW
jgi:hypothetical protein